METDVILTADDSYDTVHRLYQCKVDVDMLNIIKKVLVDVSSVCSNVRAIALTKG